jgi:hypothetical protein
MFSQAMNEKSLCGETAWKSANSQPILVMLQCSITSKSRNQGDPSHQEKGPHPEGLEGKEGKASQENMPAPKAS